MRIACFEIVQIKHPLLIDIKQELYNIAADVMPILVQQAGEDPTKMQAILLKAQADPVSFLNSLPPEIQVKIKNAANAVEKNQVSGQKP